MELFKIEELEQVSPLFRGKAGHGLARGIFKALGISRIQEGYDRNDCYPVVRVTTNPIEGILWVTRRVETNFS